MHALSYTPKLVSKERMTWAVDIILSLQNPDGGFASYELIRGTKYMELINPAEVFVGCFVLRKRYVEKLLTLTAGQHYDRIQLPGMHDGVLDSSEHLHSFIPRLSAGRCQVSFAILL